MSEHCYYIANLIVPIKVETYHKEVAEYYRLLYNKRHDENCELLVTPEPIKNPAAVIQPEILVIKLIMGPIS